MINNLDRNVQAQMRGFYEACGAVLKKDIIWNIESLKEGLNWLGTWDATKKKQALSCPIKALSAKDDTIVTAQMSAKIWNQNDIEWSNRGGHVLPLKYPKWCALQINKVIDAL